jgi:integrase
MNVTEAIAAWRSYRERMVTLHLVAESTYDNQTAIGLQLQRAIGDHPLGELRKSHIELWMGERLQRCSPVTVRGEMNVLRQILRWCMDEGHLLTLPRFPKLSVPNTEAPLPSDEAFAWVLANVGPPHGAALEFMMLTGLSPHELERVKQCDWTMQGISIGQRADFAVKQESRRRVVPLSGRAETIWFEASAGCNGQAHPFPSVAAMQKAIRRAVKAAGQNDWPGRTVEAGASTITPKLMRKWFASKVSETQPEHVLQRLMGHAPGSPITRRNYVRSSDEQMSDAVAGIAPLR